MITVPIKTTFLYIESSLLKTVVPVWFYGILTCL